MMSDPDWETSEQSGDPPLLIIVIEKHVVSHTDNIYIFASVYKQEQILYTFHQNDITNNQWYENFDTKYDIANAIGVTRYHKVFL